jgi:mannosylglucosylglycerate synthase
MHPGKQIGVFHYQLGSTDGVSLEIEKWRQVLENLGCSVHYCAGDLGAVQGTLIPDLYHHLPQAEQLYQTTFAPAPDCSPAEYQQKLDAFTARLIPQIRAFLIEKKIDTLLVENIWSVAASPAAAVALEVVRQELNIPAVAHSHDFYWERYGDRPLFCAAARQLVRDYLPPIQPGIRHAVINSLAQTQLRERKGVEAAVVPNVFDFQSPDWKQDSFNQDLRESLGLSAEDVVILQATRIVPRKGIELALDFTRTLGYPRFRDQLEKSPLYDGRSFGKQNRIVLLLAGYARDDLTATYLPNLRDKARQDGVDLVLMADRIAAQRGFQDGHKIYSLWDAYTAADLVTYPSLWEGWGNQFLEAVKAKLPLVLFEYPVYQADIKQHGFQVISLGDQHLPPDEQGFVQVEETVLETAAVQALRVLTQSGPRREMVEHNYRLAAEHFSLESLAGQLEELFSNLTADSQ